ncbi:MAG: winged helix-turn-helix domain-containing protein [Anaerolineae bacterium]|nr:winged helix-turn-helix domain-containing protein [Thermoflexales bacterium]MDW8406593.1 winged helix-turn-helix domain-containing protein [Anaerolineae bacterium]
MSEETAEKKIAVYMTNGEGPDEAILQGLHGAGCEVTRTHSIAQTLEFIHSLPPEETPLLIAEVQSGAMPLLAILREYSYQMPPTVLLDRVGNDIYAPIKALEFGVKAYLLVSQPPIERQITTQLTAERAFAESRAALHESSSAGKLASKVAGSSSSEELNEDFDWDPVSHVIRIAGKYIHLSPIEGRIFNLLVERRGRTVTLREFMQNALKNPNVSEKTALEQLRPHIMRLRRKLAVYPPLAERIVNTRGSGYMMI